MATSNYFAWLSGQTVSVWNNDSAVHSQVEHAVANGAIGCTTNPPLSYEALTVDAHLYRDDLAAIPRNISDDDFALEAMGLVVRRLARIFLPLHEQKGTYYGAVRAQVQPNLRDDAQGMLEKGKKIASWGKNVMVKIPATQAGIQTLEELAALGIPTNPTVVTTVSQAIAACEAFERGCKRAEQAGIQPAWSTCAFVMGRSQDFFAHLNEERGLGLTHEELSWAALALLKHTAKRMQERGYRTVLMPAAFRHPLQVEQLAGGRFCSTIHPKIQKQVEEADALGNLRRELLADVPVDSALVEKVCQVLPEFRMALEEGALSPEEYGTFGASKLTLDGFEATGWQRLLSLK